MEKSPQFDDKADREATEELERLTANHATQQIERVQTAARRLPDDATQVALGAPPRKKRKTRDPLHYAANVIGLSTLLYLGVSALLRLGTGKLFTLFHAEATLENPVAVPEWALGLANLFLPALGLLAAYGFAKAAASGSPLAWKLTLKLPHKAVLWLFLPVFLGASLLCDLFTSVFQRFLAAHTAYTAPAPVGLPDSGFAMLLYFLGMCVVPALLEELLVRGAMQPMLSRWGVWFSVIVSSAVFTLLHTDVAAMPALFVSSVLLGLAAYCTGSLAVGIGFHFANNVMAFCFLYATQKMDGVSALALTGYLMLLFVLAALGCAVFIWRNKVMSLFRPIPRVYDPKNRQSRFERLATTPLFLLAMLGMAVRAVLPLFLN